MDDKFEYLIREALEEEINNTEESSELFLRIRAGIYYRSFAKQYKPEFRKPLAAVVLCAVMLIGLLFGFSGQTEILAAEVINAVKNFFILDDDMNVVEKPSNEVELPFSITGGTTILSEGELEKLLGYKISFPSTLPGDYKLVDKALGLSLEKGLTYDTFIGRLDSIHKALEDDSELRGLEKYSPYRFITGTYRNNSGLTIFISTSPATKKSNQVDYPRSITRIKIGSINGEWIKHSVPIYPYKSYPNNVIINDLAKPPIKIKTVYLLSWKNKKVKYEINNYLYDKTDLSLEIAKQIAGEFMEKQPHEQSK
jgi:hypothetical protein